jgi:hypothetical protein
VAASHRATRCERGARAIVSKRIAARGRRNETFALSLTRPIDELSAGEVAVTPDQPTSSNRSKSVLGDVEVD